MREVAIDMLQWVFKRIVEELESKRADAIAVKDDWYNIIQPINGVLITSRRRFW